MIETPTLTTARLLLRPPVPSDAPAIAALIGVYEVAAMMGSVPYPYPPEAAEEFIASAAEKFARGEELNLAITTREDAACIGCTGLRLQLEHDRAEIGYWVGVRYWGKGYATEAALALVAYGFDTLKLNRIYAHHFGVNAASGRVMRKLGMRYEGCWRQHVLRLGTRHDMECYAILREEWEALRTPG